MTQKEAMGAGWPRCPSQRDEERLEEIEALKRRGLETWDDLVEERAIRRRQTIRGVRERRAK